MSGLDSANPFLRLRTLAARYCEVPGSRPVTPGVVTDTSAYVYPGNAYLQVQLGGDRTVRAIYRDGPAPSVGDRLQLIRMGPDTGSPWLAFPLPQPAGCGLLYVSGYSLTDGSWRVFRCDTAIGNVWQDRSAHPLGGATFPRRPLLRPNRSSLGFPHPERLYTWGSDLAYGTPGALYGSDDQGATWADQGIAVVNVGRAPSNQGYLFAVSASALYCSPDGGDTWATLAGPGGTYRDVLPATGFADFTLAVYTASGVYYAQTSGGAIVSGWTGPYTPAPGAAGYLGHVAATGFDYDDGATVYAASTGSPPGAGTASYTPTSAFTAGATWAYPHFQAWNDYHSATDHPAGLTPDVAGFASIASADHSHGCAIVGLADATVGVGHTRYVSQFDGPGVPWLPLDDRQVADLGAAFAPSPDGLTA